MYSVEDGNDNRIFASKSFILSFLFFNINKNAKELFKFLSVIILRNGKL